jgi:hypothetical protein
VQVTAIKLRGEPIALSAAMLRTIPVVKCNSRLLEAVVNTANYDAAWQEEYVRAMEGNPSPDLFCENEGFYYNSRLWIPDDWLLKRQILNAEHNLTIVRYRGQDKTIELVRRHFFWAEMKKFIENHICSCPECLKNNAPQHARYSLLQHLELVYHQ